ncbi:S-adenosylmethionine decarboxylase family protein [Flindersiella endophytica]
MTRSTTNAEPAPPPDAVPAREYQGGQLTHLIVTGRGCAGELNDPRALARTCTEAADSAGLRIVAEAQYSFTPHGATVALILAQSHLVVSTWPEHRLAVADIAICGPRATALRAWRMLTTFLKPASRHVEECVIQLGADEVSAND